MDRAYLRDLLIASDPELARLRQAARATLTALVATIVLDLIASAIGQPTSVALIGINTAMTGSVLVNDPAPRDQRITHALVPIVASMALVLGSLAGPLEWLRTALFLTICFVAVLVRRYGPRGQALGMIGFLAYFFSLFFQAQAVQLPLMIAGIFVASALGYAVRFGLLRERPQAQLSRRMQSLRSTIAAVLFHLACAAAEGHASRRRVQAVQRGLDVVNESALAIEDLLAQSFDAESAALGDRVFALELAIEMLAAPVHEWLAAPSIPEPQRAILTRALDAARAPVREPGPHAQAEARRALDAARAQLDLAAGERAPATPVARVLEAIDELLRASPRRAPLPRPRRPGERAAPTAPKTTPTLRRAVQATFAAALALVLGAQVSSTRAYWAVVAAFMVFSRANTRGAMLMRAWQRVVGTVVGVLLGLLVAEAVQGHVYLELAVVFACMFIAYYTLPLSYAGMVVAFTTLIAVLYSLLGRFSPELLYLRVLETLVGAGVGAGVAALVFPSYTLVAIRRGVAEGLQMFADHLEQTLVRPSSGERLALARAIDRKLHELRTEVQRASGGPSLRRTRERERLFIAFSAVLFHARPLVNADELSAAQGPLRGAVIGLVNEARALAAQLEDRRGQGPDLDHLDIDELRARGGDHPSALLRSLERVDAALHVLAQVISEIRKRSPPGERPRE